MKKIFLTFAVIYAVLISSACPQPSPASIEKARSASSRLSSLANQGVNITRQLYREKAITPELAKTIAGQFALLASGGIAFNAALAALEKQASDAGTAATKSQLEQLFSVFNQEVIAKFLAVLASAKLVKNAGVLAEAVMILQTAVLTIAKAFGRGSQVRQQISAAAGS